MDHNEQKPTAQANGKTIILEQSAHCDWDWWNTFLQYYNGDGPNQDHEAVKTTLAAAVTLMGDYQNQTTNYVYAFCEMAYLKQYVEDNPTQIDVIKNLAQFLSLSSGGMTSADNLLSHGEAFIRNYLLGRQWAINVLGITPTLQMWIPDDFGHDAQLPIVLQAMGFTGAGFWRIGGNQPGNECITPSPSAPSSILSSSVGLDFIWQASDKSSVQAHWLINSYCEGNNVIPSSNGEGTDNEITWNQATQSAINNLIEENLSDYTVSSSKPTPIPQPTPYLFVPVDCDFCTPFANLPDIINDWNLCNQNGGSDCFSTQPPVTAGYVAQMSTFDNFMKLVQQYNEANNTLKTCYSNPPAGGTLFLPNPFFSGCYGSRPELKYLHYKTTRTLMKAEALEIFLEYLAVLEPSLWNQLAVNARTLLDEGWENLVPSTHHDYITGTAPDTVYKAPPPNGEQLSDLQSALASAEATASTILKDIVAAVPLNSTSGVWTVAVFNSLGFARSGVAEMESPGPGIESAVTNGQDYFPVQYKDNSDGTTTLLFMVDDSTGMAVPSIGYSTVYLSNKAATSTPVLSWKTGDQAGTYVLANEFISAVINPQGVADLYDLVNDPSQANSVLGADGSSVAFYNDSGNIYRFGNELPCDESTFNLNLDLDVAWGPLSLTEEGPLRVTVSTKGTLTLDEQIEFTADYSVLAGEPFVRVSITGAAPSVYSVMVKIPFPSAIGNLTYGTPYHWDTRAPRNYLNWPPMNDLKVEGMTFEPTHEFVLPTNAEIGNYLAGIYHESTPGWAIEGGGNLLGCILRNTPGEQQAAWGTDSDSHTAKFALRVAGKAGSATQLLPPSVGCNPGGPLGEALQFNNPLEGYLVPATTLEQLPTTMSLAATVDPTAVIMAMKAGTVDDTDLILRVYQPTNESLEGVQVNLAPQLATMFESGGVLNVAGATALETPLDSSNLALEPSQTSFTFTAPFAITTLALSRA